MRAVVKHSHGHCKGYIRSGSSHEGPFLFIIVFRLVRDVVANHKTTRYAGAATKVIQKITLLKYNVGVQAALYAKER